MPLGFSHLKRASLIHWRGFHQTFHNFWNDGSRISPFFNFKRPCTRYAVPKGIILSFHFLSELTCSVPQRWKNYQRLAAGFSSRNFICNVSNKIWYVTLIINYTYEECLVSSQPPESNHFMKDHLTGFAFDIKVIPWASRKSWATRATVFSTIKTSGFLAVSLATQFFKNSLSCRRVFDRKVLKKMNVWRV